MTMVIYEAMDAALAEAGGEKGEDFVTCLLGRLDLLTGALTWINVGHPLRSWSATARCCDRWCVLRVCRLVLAAAWSRSPIMCFSRATDCFASLMALSTRIARAGRTLVRNASSNSWPLIPETTSMLLKQSGSCRTRSWIISAT